MGKWYEWYERILWSCHRRQNSTNGREAAGAVAGPYVGGAIGAGIGAYIGYKICSGGDQTCDQTKRDRGHPIRHRLDQALKFARS